MLTLGADNENLGTCLLCNQVQGWCDWDQLSSQSICLNAPAGVCVDPVGVSSSEDGGVLVGCEGVIVDHRTEVWRLGVSHHPTLITIGGKAHADKVVHPHCFGSSDLRYSVDRAPDCRPGHGGRDIVGGDRTEQRACGNLTMSPSVAESAKPTANS